MAPSRQWATNTEAGNTKKSHHQIPHKGSLWGYQSNTNRYKQIHDTFSAQSQWQCVVKQHHGIGLQPFSFALSLARSLRTLQIRMDRAFGAMSRCRNFRVLGHPFLGKEFGRKLHALHHIAQRVHEFARESVAVDRSGRRTLHSLSSLRSLRSLGGAATASAQRVEIGPFANSAEPQRVRRAGGAGRGGVAALRLLPPLERAAVHCYELGVVALLHLVRRNGSRRSHLAMAGNHDLLNVFGAFQGFPLRTMGRKGRMATTRRVVLCRSAFL